MHIHTPYKPLLSLRTFTNHETALFQLGQYLIQGSLCDLIHFYKRRIIHGINHAYLTGILRQSVPNTILYLIPRCFRHMINAVIMHILIAVYITMYGKKEHIRAATVTPVHTAEPDRAVRIWISCCDRTERPDHCHLLPTIRTVLIRVIECVPFSPFFVCPDMHFTSRTAVRNFYDRIIPPLIHRNLRKQIFDFHSPYLHSSHSKQLHAAKTPFSILLQVAAFRPFDAISSLLH